MNESLRLARPPTLAQMAVDQLRDAIVSGRFQPGQRLVEMELSESFGVSRAPLREAFRILAAEGLIEFRQNRGCIVANPSLEELEQVILFRALIEGAAARLVTARRDKAALDHLAAIHQQMAASGRAKDNLPFLDAYWAFHRSLTAFSGNNLLLQSWNTISTTHQIFMSRSYSHFEDRREIITSTQGFLRCFRAGDASQAEAVVRSMIVWMGYTLLDSLIPADVADYVTHIIDEEGRVARIDPHQLSARKRPGKAKTAAAGVETTKPRPKSRQSRAR
jgi:DNA-binding GntR family transcriptional regulator